MKTIDRCCAQGELLLRRIDKIPDGAKEDKGKDRLIIGHSETGHHHVLDGVNATVFRLENDPWVCYLQISESYADLVHQRGFDTHESLRLLKGSWEVHRQREGSRELFRRVED